MNRLVFIEQFVDCDGAFSEGKPCVKAWGLFDDYSMDFVPLHTEPKLKAIRLFAPQTLYEEEKACLRYVKGRDIEVPDEVYRQMARLALVGEAS